RATASQAVGSGFESRLPLWFLPGHHYMDFFSKIDPSQTFPDIICSVECLARMKAIISRIINY
ncbi:MAG: hypothetical protein ABI683_13110, partial [Ginsengibacter sp.]